MFRSVEFSLMLYLARFTVHKHCLQSELPVLNNNIHNKTHALETWTATSSWREKRQKKLEE